MKKVVLILFLVFFVVLEVSGKTDRIVCYFDHSAANRIGLGLFNVQDISPNLCTHLIYSSIGLNATGDVQILDPAVDIDQGGFNATVALKRINPNLRVLIGLGGTSQGSSNFSIVANSPKWRLNLVNSVYNFLGIYGFDGVDLDWEFPGQNGGTSSDKNAFIDLIRLFRIRFGIRYLLTASVAALKKNIPISYDVPRLVTYLDFINIMTYNIHGAEEGVTGEDAPLYSNSLDVGPQAQQANVNSAIIAWLSAATGDILGFPNILTTVVAPKFNLGIPAFGRTFTLNDTAKNGIGAPVSGPGMAGSYTNKEGYLSYLEICESELNGNGWQIVYNSEQGVPYAYNNDQWVGYDGPQSVQLKVQLAKCYNMGGVSVWSIDNDDANNICGQGKYPILQSVFNSVKAN